MCCKCKNIIKVQNIVRSYILNKRMEYSNTIIENKKCLTISSRNQTKEWRQHQEWYSNGKKNECEIYQRRLLEELTNTEIKKTNTRLDIDKVIMIEKRAPLTEKNGFSYTEDFDGLWKRNEKEFYVNLKLVCGSGGAQTRTIREVYHFILTQYKYLYKEKKENIYFVNIIDGDIGYKYIYENNGKSASLLDIEDIEEYSGIKSQVYIGDSDNFAKWYYSILYSDSK